MKKNKSIINENKKLQDKQIELLNKICGQLVRGDITAISKKVQLTKEYVGLVLNPTHHYYNENIVKEAVRIIEVRQKVSEKLLEKISEII